MSRSILIYEAGAALWAGRLLDRLVNRFGENEVAVRFPDDDVDIDESDAESTLVAVVGGNSGRQRVDTHVRLAMAQAARAGTTIIVVDIANPPASEDATGLRVRDVDAILLELPTDHFDERCDDVVDAIEATIDDPDRLVVQVRAETRTVAAFVGLTASLPIDQASNAPRQIESWAQFVEIFGGFVGGALLPYAVHGWFANGGRRCYVVSVATRVAYEPFVDGAAASDVALLRSIIGDAGEPTGLRALEGVDDIDLVAIPDLWTMCADGSGRIDLDTGRRVQSAAIAFAEDTGSIAILDPPPGLLAAVAHEWRTNDAGYDTPFACLYHPWLTVADPTNGSRLDIPPCGHVAGTWARSARERGIWRAPANLPIHDVVGAAGRPNAGERYLLGANGVNPIRTLARSDVRAWGSRTLTSEVALRDIGVCRLVQTIRRACGDGLGWLDFAPATAETRTTARRAVERCLVRLWRDGALVGDRRAEAFVVDCIDVTTADGPRIRVQVRVAPLYPGEFRVMLFGPGLGRLGAVVDV